MTGSDTALHVVDCPRWLLRSNERQSDVPTSPIDDFVFNDDGESASDSGQDTSAADVTATPVDCNE